MENLNGGEITLLLLLIANLVLGAYQHGKPKKGTENFYLTFIATALTFLLYKWAGLF